jgi:hypothetical protein
MCFFDFIFSCTVLYISENWSMHNDWIICLVCVLIFDNEILIELLPHKKFMDFIFFPESYLKKNFNSKFSEL